MFIPEDRATHTHTGAIGSRSLRVGPNVGGKQRRDFACLLDSSEMCTRIKHVQNGIGDAIRDVGVVARS